MDLMESAMVIMYEKLYVHTMRQIVPWFNNPQYLIDNKELIIAQTVTVMGASDNEKSDPKNAIFHPAPEAYVVYAALCKKYLK